MALDFTACTDGPIMALGAELWVGVARKPNSEAMAQLGLRHSVAIADVEREPARQAPATNRGDADPLAGFLRRQDGGGFFEGDQIGGENRVHEWHLWVDVPTMQNGAFEPGRFRGRFWDNLGILDLSGGAVST